MTWYEDLSECDYLPLEETSRLEAVGWLEDNQPYERGSVSVRDLEFLFELSIEPWQPLMFLGVMIARSAGAGAAQTPSRCADGLWPLAAATCSSPTKCAAASMWPQP